MCRWEVWKPVLPCLLVSLQSTTMTSTHVVSVKSVAQLKALPRYATGAVVINFYAPWSDLSKQLDVVFATLAGQQTGITFASVRA